jgi:uncharacterized cupredoxin-like copper-binding protein
MAIRISLIVAVVAMLVGCSGSGSPSAAPAASPGDAGTMIATALTEFKISLSATTAPAGSVTFALSNDGQAEHEFVVFGTDLAADQLPLSADGTEVDEAGAGLTLVNEVEGIAIGAKPSLGVTLPAAHYVLICNLPAHYTSGMRVEFTTTGS